MNNMNKNESIITVTVTKTKSIKRITLFLYIDVAVPLLLFACLDTSVCHSQLLSFCIRTTVCPRMSNCPVLDHPLL